MTYIHILKCYFQNSQRKDVTVSDLYFHSRTLQLAASYYYLIYYWFPAAIVIYLDMNITDTCNLGSQFVWLEIFESYGGFVLEFLLLCYLILVLVIICITSIYTDSMAYTYISRYWLFRMCYAMSILSNQWSGLVRTLNFRVKLRECSCYHGEHR